ncbi:MAG: hypothetical protein JW797_06980 [Bradymonadales bacterium]|nr:hypothetical protein [Bradymonadales bacterium]
MTKMSGQGIPDPEQKQAAHLEDLLGLEANGPLALVLGQAFSFRPARRPDGVNNCG